MISWGGGGVVFSLLIFRKFIRRAIFAFCYHDEARNIKGGNWERQIYFKNNLNCFVINVL